MSERTPDYAYATFVAAISVALLLIFGACAHTALSCWHRGGHVVKNLADWPVCIEATHDR